MRTIGTVHSTTGYPEDKIVSLTADEYYSLVRLSRAVNGDTAEKMRWNPAEPAEIDLGPALSVIDTFTKLQALYNDLCEIEEELLFTVAPEHE